MVLKVKQLVAPPVFEDEDKTRVAGLLNTITLAILLILIAVSVITPLIFDTPTNGLIISLMTAIPVLGVFLLTQYGHIQLASHLFVFGFWALDTILIFISGGLDSGVLPGYVAVVVLAGLLLNRRSAIILYVVMVVSGSLMLYAPNYNLMPVQFLDLEGLAKWLSLTTNIVFAATLLDLTTNGINQALARARRDEKALSKANKKLKKENTERKRTEGELRQLKEFNEDIVQSVGDAIIIEDENGILTFTNPRVETLLGYSPKDLVGRHWSAIVPDGQIENVRGETAKRPEGIESQYEITLQKKDRTLIPVIASARPLFDEGRFTGVLTAFTDISERRYAEQALMKSEEKFRTLVENINVGVYRTNGGINGKFIHANTAIVKMFGYESLDEFMEVSFADFHEKPDDRERFVNEIQNQGSVKDRELRLLKKDGTQFWASCTSTAQYDNGKLKWIDGVIEEITKRKQAEDQLVHDAFHDTLTNLPNRALFNDRLKHAMARASRRANYHYAVLFLDLDRFKLINDSLGHNAGDQLLILVADRLSSFLRSVDTIARLGGDEFVILIDEIGGIGEAVNVANRIQSELKQPFTVDGQEVYTSASIGIVYHSDEYDSPGDILRDADTAMYRAKRMGKDRYELFDLKMRQDVIHRMQIETELRRAHELGEFRTYYQPMISTKTDQIIGFEALIRWKHPERGLLLPKDFLDVAEETGLIIPMGQLVFQEACKMIKLTQQKLQQDPPVFVSVNLSRRQFTHPGLITDIKRALELNDLDPCCLAMEITEDVIIDDSKRVSSTLQKILDLGVKIQMDDFGTGYSSLATLHRFPIGALKIAREFIIEIESSEDRSAVVSTIISLARALNINVIAEGVENSHQLDYLKKENCDMWQGFYCSKPVSEKSLKKFFTDKYGTGFLVLDPEP
jgi:diguanylate cyclase (GGDEF)-like protein/PAS domain S-box-containing protein